MLSIASWMPGAPGFIYARDGHPNARQLADQLAGLEGAKWSVVCGSGMAAISAVVLSLVANGERIVASNRLYGRTTQLFMEELPRFGVTTTLVDTNDLDAVRTALEQPAQDCCSWRRSPIRCCASSISRNWWC